MNGQNIRRPERALSARFVETVTKPGKYFDGQGLFLRVARNGARQWVQRIVIQGKRRELGLGSPPAVTLAAARKKALDNRGSAMLGGNPLAEKRKARDVMTFSAAIETYLAAKLSEFRNEKHRKQWRATLETYAVPVIGHKPVSEIDTSDVLRVLEPIWHGKTETAKRLRGRIENILSWATVSGRRVGDNPARWKGNLSEILPKPSKVAKTSNLPALALADAQQWWTDLEQRDGMAAHGLRFIALTAARSGEVRGATWEEFDLAAAVWTVPKDRMKNGRAHRVPLTMDAIALLEYLPRLDGSPFVFFAPRGGQLSEMSISGVMRRMQETEEKAGRPGYLDPSSKRPAVPHGLRSTFRQWTAEQGYPRDMAEIALAHFIGSDVERTYQRSDMLERRRDMMTAWAAFLRVGSVAGGNMVRLEASR